MRAATARHMEEVSGKARRPFPMEMARATGLEETEGEAGAGAGHAGELEVAVARRLSRDHGHASHDELLGIRVVDADESFAVDGVDDALLDGEGPHRRGAVAAIARVVHVWLADLHLRKRIVDVGAGLGGGSDDAGLGQRGDAAAAAGSS